MEDFLLIGFAAFVVLAVLAESNAGAVDQSPVDFGEEDLPDFTGQEVVSADNMSTPGKLVTFADSIFHFEGGNPGDLNVRNNNPGNLKAAPDQFTGSVTERDANGFVIFPSMDAGFGALYAQLTKTIGEFPQINLQQFFARYLGQSNFLQPQVTNQGNPFTYAQNVADKLGVSPTDSLQSIFGG